MNRIACLRVPLFPLAARLRSEPELLPEALAILSADGPRARVVAATRLARRAGIRPGLSLAQARARLPKLIARSRDPACEEAARQALLDVAESFSPRVEDAGEGLAYLDIDGLDRMYRGADALPEFEFGRELMRGMEQRAGMPVGVGIASGKLTARLAAETPGSPTIIPAGEEIALLAPLPLARAELVCRHLSAKVLTTLERWGVRSLGELAALPTDQVASRLGEAGRELQDIARGLDPHPLIPREPPSTFIEAMELEWPLVTLEPFLFLARAALERLTVRMAGRDLACRRLELALLLDPDGRIDRALDLPAATRDVKTLLTLLRLDLEAHPPGAPVVAFEIAAHPDRPRRAQLSLFGEPALSPEKLATTLAQLFALLGEERVGSPRAVDAHAPERFHLEPYAPPPPPDGLVGQDAPSDAPPRRGRALLAVRALRPPLAVEVRTEPAALRPRELRAVEDELEVSDTPRDAPRRPRVEGPVRVASGPWHLEEGWWTEKPMEREYWDVELARGGLYRLFHDRREGTWWVDGIYD